MIEKTVLDYLSDKFPAIPVFVEVPEQVPGKYIIIEKTGGSMTNHIFTATLAIKSIAPTLYEAAALNDVVIGTMLNVVNECDISSCRLNSNYNFTNTRTKEYRYQAVFDVVY